MLRFHFTAEDLTRTRVAGAPHPLWEIAVSLHRFQTREGRWAYAHWHRTTCARLHEAGLERKVKNLLLPLFPRAIYFPDFLTPLEGAEGLEAGLDAILAAPRGQVAGEIARLARTVRAPAWAHSLTEPDTRSRLTELLRTYAQVVIDPYEEHIAERLCAERVRHANTLLCHGTEGLLGSLAPTIRWSHPLLEIDCYPEERDVHLGGRGLLLIPSYFCWNTPVALADPGLPPVLLYPLQHAAEAAPATDAPPLHALLGRTRAAILRATATGVTTTDAARQAGVSTGTATHHTTVLRDAGLITSHRHANTVLHTLTRLGAALLAREGRAPQRPDPDLAPTPNT
ncbi:helix-turn-helix domain-containing protein [Streptomyces sp. HUAS ZL42]|uniref:ArsR/SmtB family transcription factor n=1 Tax=Streptomyces sp. HUAS ZL42 TaxID=3231715 RepID=UPI00345E8A30